MKAYFLILCLAIASYVVCFYATVKIAGKGAIVPEAQASGACYKMICVEGNKFIVWTCGGGIAQVMEPVYGRLYPVSCKGD